VFREVAGEHATYFDARTNTELVPQLADWIGKLGDGTAPRSHGISPLTWLASAEHLKLLITDFARSA
jgi:hypothetical protein